MALTTNLPSLYEYYTNGGITQGLSANQTYFTLNERNITLYSGAMHYFRVPKAYWRDRLRKMRAAGLNTVETYIPWNLHEPEPGKFDFGEGGSDMTEFLDLKHFFQLAKEEDLLAIARPGPYICSEWEFGGFPSWLLREGDLEVRTSQPKYMEYVKRYFNVLLPILAMLQFTKGGPIIMFQVENEYGSTQRDNFLPDKLYLRELRSLMVKNGIVELLATSDSAHSGTSGSLPEYFLLTANFGTDPEEEFNVLSRYQKDKPSMAMEYYPGWFDHWTEEHHTTDPATLRDVYERILKYPASVNIYMFHGGTSWGFLNGANRNSIDNKNFQPDTTSYDYNSPISEAGDYTEKYVIIKELLAKYNKVLTRLPLPPSVTLRKAFPSTKAASQLTLSKIVEQIPRSLYSERPVPMELLSLNDGAGQSYGYTVYRKRGIDIAPNAVLKIQGRVCDTVMVLVNDVLVSKPLSRVTDLNGFGYWRMYNSTLPLSLFKNATLDLVVENWGRVNYGDLEQFKQYKGLQQSVYLDDDELFEWEIYPLEFKRKWTEGLQNWHPRSDHILVPSLYKFLLDVPVPADTFIDMRKWRKGIVIVNGFVLGRYTFLGPQQTLYCPAPLLKRGVNEILVFEHFQSNSNLEFSEDPIYLTKTEI